jgi:hypothetical protein
LVWAGGKCDLHGEKEGRLTKEKIGLMFKVAAQSVGKAAWFYFLVWLSLKQKWLGFLFVNSASLLLQGGFGTLRNSEVCAKRAMGR